MMRLKLVEPSESYREQILSYRAEFLLGGDFLHGCAGLGQAPSFEAWLQAVRNNSREETVSAGLVPASSFLAVRLADRRLIGFIDIRHRLNEALLRAGGHIGYSVRPGERGNGYAKEMLTLALPICRSFGLRRVLITCSGENIASARVIRSCGGMLENEVRGTDAPVQRYWIAL